MKVSCTPHIKKVDQNKVIVQGPNTVRLGSGSEALRTRLHRTPYLACSMPNVSANNDSCCWLHSEKTQNNSLLLMISLQNTN